MGADKKANPQQNLEIAIPRVIRLLKAQQYAEFLQSYVPPDEVKKITASGKFDAMAEKFEAKKAPRLLEALEAVPTAKLTFDKEKQIATFTLKEPIAGKPDVRFVKIGALWYVAN